MDKRLEIRKRIRSDATNLCSLVVNTAVEFKEELITLENENRKLNRKNKKQKNTLNNLRDQNEFLLEELESRNEKIERLIVLLGTDKLCYNCDHPILCRNSASLCIYCSKWVCHCCMKYCSEPVLCTDRMCNSCFLIRDKCPTHIPNFPPEQAETLTANYRKNRYNRDDYVY